MTGERVGMGPSAPSRPVASGGGILSTLNEDGSRRWLKPRLSAGRWWTRRRGVAYLLIALFTLLPHVRIGERPAVLVDLAARRLTLAGHTFHPTDTLLLALLLLSVAVGIFLVSALMGRVWCGWACPQTVYMEFLYRPVERLLEGAPGSARGGREGRGGRRGRFVGSGAARALKVAIYFAFSCFLAHTFLAYFVGTEKLAVWVTQSPLEHPTPFLVMATVTGLMLFNFGFFREQTCVVACPYGRMQSALLDRHSLIVSYDARRGEPRGRRRAGDISLPVAGDCVDCHMCVATCPTGIDIRNGLQMECIHCTQCIDACDAVMDKLGKARGLVRYASQATVAGEARRVWRPRMVVYPAILAVLAGAFVTVLLRQGPVDVTVLRGLGAPFVMVDPGTVGNQVRIKLVNRTGAAASYVLGAEDAAGVEIRAEENPVVVGPGESRTVPALVTAPLEDFADGPVRVRVTVMAGEERTSREYTLQGPGGRP